MSIYLITGLVFLILFMLSGIFGIYLMEGESVYLLEFMLFNWGGFDLKYEVLVDWVSVIYLSVVLLISGSVMIYSNDYMSGDINKNRFILLSVMFVVSMIFLVMSGGLISVLLGWDGLGLVSYCLVIYYGSSVSYKAGMITILTNRVGDALLLVSVGWLLMYGDWNFWLMEYELINLEYVLVMMIIIAACTKSAQVPFSAWLPEAMMAPTPVSSLVHSSTLVTAGVFLMIRFNYFFLSMNYFLLFLSMVTMLMAGFGALVEMDMKKVVAMSTLSQLGFMMFCLSIGLWKMAYFHSVVHAFFKALMFLCVGSIIYGMGGNQDFRFISSKMDVSWVIQQGLLISVLCLMGFPFLCGFFSKDLILGVFFMSEKSLFVMVLFFFGVSMSVMYGVRLYLNCMMGEGMELSYGNFKEMKWMNMGIFILLVMSLVSGGSLMWLFKFNYVIFLKWPLMMFGLFMFMMFFMMMVSERSSSKLFIKKFLMLKVFLGSLWFLGWSTSGVWSGLMKKAGEVEKIDQEWNEEYGGKGFGYLMISSVVKMHSLISNMMGYFMIYLIGMMMYLCIIVYIKF